MSWNREKETERKTAGDNGETDVRVGRGRESKIKGWKYNKSID